jgi:iron complex outermembrane recepter protein
MKSYYLPLVIALCPVIAGFAQDTPAEQPTEDLYALSLEELMNVPINSASKKDETLFEAPLSSYTITRADIDRAGSLSIMEALRLAPGVIVREQTNGVYDIHIRGFDNPLRTTLQPFAKSNLATLVMIDNRPVFNHNIGGTFWETLPVDINDVERIEIVRGPSAPLFGPNAVTGVINIITRRATSTNTAVHASVQYGTPNTLVANASIGKKINDKFTFLVSGNFQDRKRFDDDYYYIPTGDFVKPAGMTGLANPTSRYPDPEQALQRWGANAFLTYTPSGKVSFDVSLGVQGSDVQKVFLGVQTGTEPITYFTANESETQYINLAAKLYGFHLRTSVINGYDNINYGATPGEYDYTNADINVEYPLTFKKLTLTPGVSFQSAVYDDEPYTVEKGNEEGFLNAKQGIQTLAGYLRADLAVTKAWRVLAAVRADKFSSPDKTTVAYEFATTYELNDKHLLRLAFTRSNSGSFIGNNYLDVTEPTPVPNITGGQRGNKDLDLFTVTLYELGYRVKLSKSVQLDLDVFRQEADHFSTIVLSGFAPTPPFPPGTPLMYRFENLPTTATQHGATLSLNIVPNERIHFKPFITFQRTETEDLPDGPENFISPDLGLPITYTKGEHKNTPSWYGGYYFDYKLSTRFSVNLNGYFFAAHHQYDVIDPTGESDLGKIKGKVLVNAKVNFAATRQLDFFVNARNALNSDSREFFGTDQIGAVYAAGAALKLN